MRVPYKLFIVLIIIAASCSQPANKNTGTAASSIAGKDPGLARFDLLENIFKNDNWLIIDGTDSSYLYFSRLGKAYFRICQYKIVKGDSVNTIVTEIKLQHDTIVWNWPAKSAPVYLYKVAAGEAAWAGANHSGLYVFQKTDSNTIHIKYPGGDSKDVFKTITLSSFLVRSKYDYMHGTRLAFDNKQ